LTLVLRQRDSLKRYIVKLVEGEVGEARQKLD